MKKTDEGLLDAIHDILDVPGKEQIQEPVNDPPKEDEQPVNDPMTIFSIRLPKSQKDSLQAHFKNDLGLDLSPGIRMLITKYMKEHRL